MLFTVFVFLKNTLNLNSNQNGMISNIDNPKYSFFVRELGDRYIHELSDGRLDMIKTILPFRSCLLKTRNV